MVRASLSSASVVNDYTNHNNITLLGDPDPTWALDAGHEDVYKHLMFSSSSAVGKVYFIIG